MCQSFDLTQYKSFSFVWLGKDKSLSLLLIKNDNVLIRLRQILKQKTEQFKRRDLKSQAISVPATPNILILTIILLFGKFVIKKLA